MFRPYKYIKKEPLKVKETSEEIVIRLPKPKIPMVKFRKLTSAALIAGGIFLLTNQIVLPLLTAPPAQKPLLKPTAPSVAGARSKGIEVGFEFTELQQEHKNIKTRKQGNTPNIFYLTIPKLGIERAEVETNSQNLSPDERLGHYLGSALPGEVGNTFIYGHSVLPMFYDPKNYRTIFSTLDKLEKGDEISVEFGEQHFKYLVEKSVVLKPEDVKPLEPIALEFLRQPSLTLMTCVPMGLGTNRLLVQAKLVW